MGFKETARASLKRAWISLKKPGFQGKGSGLVFDLTNFGRLKSLDENAPDSMRAFRGFAAAAFSGGVLDVQQKQLIAVAVALATQCPYCNDLYGKAARC